MPSVEAFTCPHCGIRNGRSTERPNYTTISTPAAPNWTVVMISCRSCGAPFGPYTYPNVWPPQQR